MFIRRARGGTEHVCDSSEEENFDNRLGVFLDISCPALRRKEDINSSVFLSLWVVMSTNFSSSPVSSVGDFSLILFCERWSATSFVLPKYLWKRIKEDTF